MLSVAREFLNLISELTPMIRVYPYKTNDLIYDKRFTPEWLVEHLENLRGPNEEDDEMWREGGHCYQHIFDEMNHHSDNKSYMTFVCDSADVDYTYHGDYLYYYGMIGGQLNAKAVPFIYAMPSSELDAPSRLTFYTPHVQVELMACSISVNIYETVHATRNIFFTRDDDERIKLITTFLESTDRSTSGFE